MPASDAAETFSSLSEPAGAARRPAAPAEGERTRELLIYWGYRIGERLITALPRRLAMGAAAAVGNVAYDQKTVVEIEGDVKFKMIPYLFGVRFSERRNEKTVPFVHFLAGATQLKASLGSESVDETSLTWQVGGGLNINASGRLGARAGIDYMRIQGADDGELSGGEAIQGLRISAGIVVGF